MPFCLSEGLDAKRKVKSCRLCGKPGRNRRGRNQWQSTEQNTEQEEKKRKYMCGYYGGKGHQARYCPDFLIPVNQIYSFESLKRKHLCLRYL